jgi:hypothetical protein
METLRNLQSTIIVAVKASSYEEERAVVLSTGCDDFLRKPFTDAEIFEMLQKHLGIRFVYEERSKGAGSKVADSKVTGGRQRAEEVLVPEALAALPGEWMADLKKGTEEVDPDLLFSVIEQIRGCDVALADTLARLIEDFAYDEILAIVHCV